MYQLLKKSLILGALGALTALPSFAQVRVELGPLHIRIASDAPPPIRYEQRPPRPARDYIWIGGYWDRQDDRWEWTRGRWARPHDRRYSWVRPRYIRDGRAWRYEPGHWSNERLNDEEYRRWRNEHRNDR